ncbi:hypothetical protein ACLMJK_001882 [Lecanora helva]
MATVPAPVTRLPPIDERDSAGRDSPEASENSDQSRNNPPERVHQTLAPLNVLSIDPQENELHKGKTLDKAEAVRQATLGADDVSDHQHSQLSSLTTRLSTASISSEAANLHGRDSGISVRTENSPSSKSYAASDVERSSNCSPTVQRQSSGQSLSQSGGLHGYFTSRDSGYVSGSIPGHDISELESRLERVRPASYPDILENLSAQQSPINSIQSPRDVNALPRSGSCPYQEVPDIDSFIRNTHLRCAVSDTSTRTTAHLEDDIEALSSSPRVNTEQRPCPIKGPSIEDCPLAQKHSFRPLDQLRRFSQGRNDSQYALSATQYASRSGHSVASVSQQQASVSNEASEKSSNHASHPIPYLVAYNTTPANPPDRPDTIDHEHNNSSNHDEIAFNPRRVEKLSRGCYMDRTALMPDTIVQKWDKDIKPQLDQDLQELVKSVDSGKHMILSSVQLCMVGSKSANLLKAEPTIVVTCGTQQCKRRIAKSLSSLRSHYLEDFGRPIKVRYHPAPAYWAAFACEGSANSRDFSHLQQLRIQYPKNPQTACGLNIVISLSDKGIDRRVLATLGGILCIDGTFYGMTTAHAFLTGRDTMDEDKIEKSISWYSERNGFEILSGPELYAKTSHSFLGHVSRCNITSQTTKLVSDWALFPVPAPFILPNVSTIRKLLTSIIPRTHLIPGDVHILHGMDSQHTGFLTQGDVSFQTDHKTLSVREIVLDLRLPRGASGSWVVRDHGILGYIVAISNGGRSCFMIPMESAFDDIKAVLGQDVSLFWEHSCGTVGDADLNQPASAWNIPPFLFSNDQPSMGTKTCTEREDQVSRISRLLTQGRDISPQESSDSDAVSAMTTDSTKYSIGCSDSTDTSDLYDPDSISGKKEKGSSTQGFGSLPQEPIVSDSASEKTGDLLKHMNERVMKFCF